MHRHTSKALLLLAALGCQPAPSVTSVPGYNGDVCQNLAAIYLQVAESRERGTSRRILTEQLDESSRSPFHRQPARTRARMRAVVDYVYARPELPPAALGAEVLDGCTINAEGDAILLLPAVAASGPAADGDD